MRITKCDSYKKILKNYEDENSVRIKGGILGESLSLCDECFAPVLRVLQKTKLVTEIKK